MEKDLANLKGHSLPVRQLEVPAVRKDGTRIDLSIVVSGIYDAGGKLLGMSNILRDMTQRKRAERKLATLASIVNASEDAIISVSKDLKITSWNAAAEKAYGFTAAQALGQGL